MECDVIPDCTQEVDPLGNLENCDSLSDESCSYGGALNAQIISSSGASFIIQPAIAHKPSTNESTVFSSESSRRKSAKKNNHNVKKKLPRPIGNTILPPPLPTSTLVKTSVMTNPTIFTSQASTMREVLASIPGFSIKPRRRSNKKMSAAAQIEQTREGCIDLETPDSILCGTNLRSLLNKHTFSMLPPLYQYKLVQLLPIVDRPPIDTESSTIRLNSSSLNNEFFARACLEWRERLSEGEFTPENQLKLKAEVEKEKSKLDPWKLKHFEPFWGESLYSSDVNRQSAHAKNTNISSGIIVPASSIVSSNYTTSSGRIVRNPISYSSTNYCPTQKRTTRTVGVLTRSTTAAVVCQLQDVPNKNATNIPDLLPIRTKIIKPPEVSSGNPNNELSDVQNEIATNGPLTTSEEKKEDCVNYLSSKFTPEIQKSSPPFERIDAFINPQMLLMDQASKRAIKRSVSTDTNHVKVSRYSADALEKNVYIDNIETTKTTTQGDIVLNIDSDTTILDTKLKEEVALGNSQKTIELPLNLNTQRAILNLSRDSKNDIISSLNSSCIISTTNEIPTINKDFEYRTSEYSIENTNCSAPLVKTNNIEPNLDSNTSEKSIFSCSRTPVKIENIKNNPNFEGVVQSDIPIDINGHRKITSVKATHCMDIARASDESSNSNADLVDCNGDNSDDAAVEELEPSIQNLQTLEDDPIEQKFTDAENYVLESGEISGDSRGNIF